MSTKTDAMTRLRELAEEIDLWARGERSMRNFCNSNLEASVADLQEVSKLALAATTWALVAKEERDADLTREMDWAQ